MNSGDCKDGKVSNDYFCVQIILYWLCQDEYSELLQQLSSA